MQNGPDLSGKQGRVLQSYICAVECFSVVCIWKYMAMDLDQYYSSLKALLPRAGVGDPELIMQSGQKLDVVADVIRTGLTSDWMGCRDKDSPSYKGCREMNALSSETDKKINQSG